jgi:hypothetical protein
MTAAIDDSGHTDRPPDIAESLRHYATDRWISEAIAFSAIAAITLKLHYIADAISCRPLRARLISHQLPHYAMPRFCAFAATSYALSLPSEFSQDEPFRPHCIAAIAAFQPFLRAPLPPMITYLRRFHCHALRCISVIFLRHAVADFTPPPFQR